MLRVVATAALCLALPLAPDAKAQPPTTVSVGGNVIALVTVTDRGSARHVKWLRSLTLRAA